MRVLWLVNQVLPLFHGKLNIAAKGFGGGWLTGLSNSLKSDSSIELAICSPFESINKVESGTVDNVTYFLYPEKNVREYSEDTVHYLKSIVEEQKPDVIHIFGTEYPRTLAMLMAAGSEKTLISLTGILTLLAEKYRGGLPYNVVKQHKILRWIADINPHLFFLKNRLLAYGESDFSQRAQYEQSVIKEAKYVSGRTGFDYSFAKRTNPDIKYFFCNETLRDTFYGLEKWSPAGCQRYSIFVGNSGYPIKGFHKVIEAAKILKSKYSKLKIYVAGNSPLARGNGLKGILIKCTDEYGKYLSKQINRYGLSKCIEFLGNLNADAMKKAYLQANVFVLPSIIENSPNSLGEAMLLGVPCVAADVGGVSDMMKDGAEGLLYHFEDVEALAAAVSKLFSEIEYGEKLGKNAITHAMKTHSQTENSNTMISIYQKICDLQKQK